MDLIGVGIDLVDLERVRRLLAGKGARALKRLFTEEERAYLASRPDPTGQAAARIAAKEAVYKAMQALPDARGIGWRDIEVARDTGGSGRPTILLHGIAARLAEQRGGVAIQISLSHSGTAAGAIAIVSATG